MERVKVKLVVAPTEPAQWRDVADDVSMAPEEYGADAMFVLPGNRRVGIQRKTVADLLASLRDGRLQKQVLQMAQLDYAVLLVEGDIEWSTSGDMLHTRTAMDLESWRGLTMSIRDRGVWVDSTQSVADTVGYVETMRKWFAKTEHKSLLQRPGVGRDPLGVVSTAEYQAWILQSLPGIGIELSRRIVEELGMVIGLKVSVEDLCKVHGLGKGKAEKIAKILEAI